MNLKYTYSARRGKILLELETTDFTSQETMALDMLGEPNLEFQKTYDGGFTIGINKKIRTEFKVKVRIDGTKDFESANAAATEFLNDIQDALREEMDSLMDRYLDQDFPARTGTVKLTEYKP